MRNCLLRIKELELRNWLLLVKSMHGSCHIHRALSSIRQHSDINDCLEDNREDY